MVSSAIISLEESSVLIFWYNILQFTIIILFWPILLLLVMGRPKYRNRLAARLGFDRSETLHGDHRDTHTFWIHALSVGEVTSAVPLVKGLRRKYPESRIVVTTATAAGKDIAQSLLGATTDHILASPLDFLPVVQWYVRRIQPDIFILVETDFWPNLLAVLSRRNTPVILVNGRISQKSFTAYRKYSWFFLPMFQRFDRICLQSELEKEKFRNLGIGQNKLQTLGNLKYDLPGRNDTPRPATGKRLPKNRLLFIAGSTHEGEELSILQAYRQLRIVHPELYLVLAPRKPARAHQILDLGRDLQLEGSRWTESPATEGDYLLVDTIGELVYLYGECHIAFVGGSLIAAGGHNPIEPASMALPVLFWPAHGRFSGNRRRTRSLRWRPPGSRSAGNCHRPGETHHESPAAPADG